ncbi:ArsR family transcriptional regulator [Candidatus Woesearchaeota archaeon]|nr:MAG: ArsR family transcriptional regulator [Candidatus Woesearchaeota archaeon]
MFQQIILRDLEKPKEVDVIKDIEWLGDSFGFCSGRDTERIASKVFQAILKDAAFKGATSSELISKSLNLAVQRVNYHLRSLIDSGFLYREKRRIFIRQGSIKSAVEEIRKDANRIFDNLSLIAEQIDNALGLKNRF